MKSKPYHQMVGKSYLFNAEQYRVLDIIQVEPDLYEVRTNKRTIRVTPNELRKEFLPVEDKLVSGNGHDAQLAQLAAQQMGPLVDLDQVLLKQIEKLTGDKGADHLPVAKAVNETAGRLIDLQKVKLEIIKTAKHLK